MSSNTKQIDENLTFSDSYEPRICIENEKTLVWRFPLQISQSSIGGKTKLSNACTLIALKIAELVQIHDVRMPTALEFLTVQHNRSLRASGGAESQIDVLNDKTNFGKSFPNDNFIDEHQNSNIFQSFPHLQKELYCPGNVTSCLINGIIDGNEAYERCSGGNSDRVYTLPEAIKACGENFKEIDFKLCTKSIVKSLPKMLRLAVKCIPLSHHPRLMFIMIGCVRTVLMIYERITNSLTLFDTHMHLCHDDLSNDNYRHGSLICSCSYKDVNYFAEWVQDYVFPESLNSSSEFEISLVELTESMDKDTQKLCGTEVLHKVDKTHFTVFHKEKEEVKLPKYPKDYPVLRKMLSIPPKFVFKRKAENGFEECGFGRNEPLQKIARINIQNT